MRRIAASLLILSLSLVTTTCAGTAATPALSLHRIWVHSLVNIADSAPAFLPGVRGASGTMQPVVYVLAGNNRSNCATGDPVAHSLLYALDANSGALLWSQSTQGQQRCTTAGPVADPSGKWVYAPGFDGKIHRYDAATGAETQSGGWPHVVTVMPSVEKVSATLTIGSNYLYATTSGYIGDAGHYQGHLLTIDLHTGRARVFNTLCSTIRHLLTARAGSRYYCASAQSGLFGRGQGTVDPVTRDVYIVSGNGPWNGRTNWGDSILKLDPSGARLIDSYTPKNQQSLAAQDADLGSTAPAMLPPVKRQGRTYHLLVQGGKGPACDGCHGVALRLLNRDNLSGHGGPGHLGGDLQNVQAPGGCEVLTAPAVRRSGRKAWMFYANDCGVAGYRLAVTSVGFKLSQVWSNSDGGTTPVLSHGVLYVVHGGGLVAYNATTGQALWRGEFGDVHWEYPLVEGNRLFVSDQSGHVSGYAISRLP